MNPQTTSATCARLLQKPVIIFTDRVRHTGNLIALRGYRQGNSDICTTILIGPGTTTDPLTERQVEHGNIAIPPEAIRQIQSASPAFRPICLIPPPPTPEGWATPSRCRFAHYYNNGISICLTHIEPKPYRPRINNPINPCKRCLKIIAARSATNG
jgi:hypothetical protein